MRLFTVLSLVAMAVLGFAVSAGAAPRVIVFETEMGEIRVELDLDSAPRTAANFLRYVEAGLLDGSSFYRTVRDDNQPSSPVKIEVIQGGLGEAGQDRAFAPIRMESTGKSGLRHLDGTVSMARLGPHTATSEFFICVGPQPELDFGGRRNPDGQGFAAFGRVVAGMDVVRRIHRSPAVEQTLDPPVRVTHVTLN